MKIYAVVDDENGYTPEECIMGNRFFTTETDAEGYRKALTTKELEEFAKIGRPFDEDEISDDMFFSILVMDLM